MSERRPAGEPRLHLVSAPAQPRGIALVLHGGREESEAPVRRTQVAVVRMIPIAARIARETHGEFAVARLQNRVRGWNDPELDPVIDARRALHLLRSRFGPDLPISVVGHSMGGRTAMRIGGDQGVRTVVGLAPWLPPGEPTHQLAGRRVLIVHGSADRTTDPAESADFARELDGVAAQVSYVLVSGVRHGLLRRRRMIEGLTAGFVGASLLTARTQLPPESENVTNTNLVQRAIAGQARIEV